MISEPYKTKEVKHLPRLPAHDRWNALKSVGFNTYRLCSDQVTFDLVARGQSAWSHDQKAAYQTGDEAYAGSRNFLSLIETARRTLGVERLVPTHNGIGAEKLLATTMLEAGQLVLHNRGRDEGLSAACGGEPVEIAREDADLTAPDRFGADADLDRLGELLSEHGSEKIAYVLLATCPEGLGGQPISLANIETAAELTAKAGVPLVLDASNGLINGLWNLRAEKREGTPLEMLRAMIAAADIAFVDAAEDTRSDVGGFITARTDERFGRLRNQVVVFEGLHTYGGMSGRAMAVFAQGIEELRRSEYVEWHDAQVELLRSKLDEAGVPCARGARAVTLSVGDFLGHLEPADNPKLALAAALYLHGSIRARIDGRYEWHKSGAGKDRLQLELPRLSLTNDHVRHIATRIAELWEGRGKIRGLRAVHEGEWCDEAIFAPASQRILVETPAAEERSCEPYRTAILEPVEVVDKAARKAAIERAGYNTFLLDSSDIYIDLLTDSGTSAMSCTQWRGMADTQDTPYSSRQYEELVEELREALGFEHCIPTHQGRAAEHIMSQVMIRPGMSVPGNMYFTTTKLHQEMAGGVFRDVIVDEAHDPQSDFAWKGNIDVAKLDAEIERAGEIAYVSFEMSVNMAGGQPFSMNNVREVSAWCQRHDVPLMFDATRCCENARMVQLGDPAYRHVTIREILREMMSYGDGCTVSCKKDFLVNMGGLLACNDDDLAHRFREMLRIWEGEVTTGGMDPKDMEAMRIGLLESLDDDYIAARVGQTRELGRKLNEAGIPIVNPPGSHAIFLDARRFLPHLDQDEYPAQALAAAIFIETGVRAMERGNVSKGRDPKTKKNYRPALELVRLTIPRRVYTNAHFDFVVEGISRLWERRERISGFEFAYEPELLRFFQGRFEPKKPWDF